MAHPVRAQLAGLLPTLALVLLSTSPAVAQPATPVPLTTTEVPMEAMQLRYMDIMDIDQDAHMLYTGDRWAQGIDVFDVSTPEARYVKTFFLRTGGRGVRWASNIHKVFVGLDDGTLAVIDVDPNSPRANTIVARVAGGSTGPADELDYDSVHHKLYVAHRNEGFVDAFDADNNVLVNTIRGFGPALEQPRFNAADNMMYDVSVTDNALYRIDPVTDELVQTIDIGEPCGPSGLAINSTTNQALLGCSGAAAPRGVYFDLATQRVIGRADVVGGGDSAFYDPVADRFFFGTRDGGVAIYEGSPTIRYLTTVPTSEATNSSTFDWANRMVYAPGVSEGRPVLISFPLP
jgi:DNA-binding beta-propeller fold protein YncE